jgi:hypothetical protein
VAYSKCLKCRARVWHDGSPADHLDDLCPGCGDPLAPGGSLSELVGLRCLRGRPGPRHRTPPDITARISQQIRETIARNDAERQRKLEGERH